MRPGARHRVAPRARLATLVLCSVAACLPGVVAGAGADLLEALRWEQRVLLLFAPATADPRLAPFEAALARRGCAVAERDLVVARVGPGGGRLGGRELSGAEARALRERFGVADGESVVVLVGKDGGEKARSARPDLESLLARIDGMPMRRREMRERGSRCAD